MSEKMVTSPTSVSDPVAHIAPKKRKGAPKVAVLSRVILSLALALGVTVGLAAQGFVAITKDHMSKHMRAAAPEHMNSLAMRVGTRERCDHMNG